MSLLRNSSVPAHLRKSELADALPKAELRQLDQIARLVNVAEGRTIITQATPGSECFVVVDGMFAVDGPGVETTVGAGDVAGELALLTGEHRNASVVATSDAKVYAMHPDEFETLLRKAPHFCRQVVSSANARLAPESVALSAKSVPKVHGLWAERLAQLPTWRSIS